MASIVDGMRCRVRRKEVCNACSAWIGEQFEMRDVAKFDAMVHVRRVLYAFGSHKLGTIFASLVRNMVPAKLGLTSKTFNEQRTRMHV